MSAALSCGTKPSACISCGDAASALPMAMEDTRIPNDSSCSSKSKTSLAVWTDSTSIWQQRGFTGEVDGAVVQAEPACDHYPRDAPLWARPWSRCTPARAKPRAASAAMATCALVWALTTSAERRVAASESHPAGAVDPFGAIGPTYMHSSPSRHPSPHQGASAPSAATITTKRALTMGVQHAQSRASSCRLIAQSYHGCARK